MTTNRNFLPKFAGWHLASMRFIFPQNPVIICILIQRICEKCDRKYEIIYCNSEDSKAVCAELALRRRRTICE